MRAKFFKVICILLAAVIGGGCWDAVEMEDRNIAVAVIADFNEGEYVLYVEIATVTEKIQNQRSEQSQTFPPAIVISAKGKTFAQARENLDKELNKKLFLGAVQALMLTQRMAENGIAEYLYRARQINDLRKTIDVVIIKDDPRQFLESMPENAASVGFAVQMCLDKLHKEGRACHTMLSDVLETLASKNNCYLLPMLTNDNGQISLAGAAVFDGSKMVGEIGCDEQRGVVYIDARKTEPKFVYVVPVGDTHVTIEAKMKGRRITAYYEENKVRFSLDFSFQGTELYPETDAPVTNEMQQELESNLENMILQEISGAILKSRDEYGIDYFSLSEVFRIKYPDIYKNMDWDSEFKSAGFGVSVGAVLGPDKTFDYDPEKK